MTSYWTYVLPFLSPVLGAVSAYLMIRINRSYTERKSVESDEKTWRDSRKAVEQELRNLLAKSESDRLQDKLKHESDLATVTGILGEFAKSQQLLSSVATESKSHGGRLDNHDHRLESFNTSLDTIRSHIHDLALQFSKRDT